jgi:hypothetical protein
VAWFFYGVAVEHQAERMQLGVVPVGRGHLAATGCSQAMSLASIARKRLPCKKRRRRSTGCSARIRMSLRTNSWRSASSSGSDQWYQLRSLSWQ